MELFNIVLTVLGGMILLLGLVSKRISQSPFPPTLLALALGVLLGPEVLGWIDPAALGERSSVLEKAARVTLAVGLVGVALRIPREYPRRHAGEMALLVGGGMLLMWAVSAGLVYLLLDLTPLLALLIGAIITATDPIAASPIVTGDFAKKRIPARIRRLISLESGVNDGVSFLFVFLPFLLLTRAPGEALEHWVLKTLLWDVGVATLLGGAIGYAAGRLLREADDRGTVEDDWRLIYTVALGLFAAGAGRLINSDEVLVIFAAGAALVQVVARDERGEEERGQEAVNRFLAVPIFTLLGLTLPWEEWAKLGWSGVLLAVAVLALRRPLAILVLGRFLPSVRSRPDLLFVGWFGPIAVAAIYYAGLMEHRLNDPRIWAVVSLVVVASTLAHGATGAPFTRLYARTTGNQPDEEEEDGEEAGEAPIRVTPARASG